MLNGINKYLSFMNIHLMQRIFGALNFIELKQGCNLVTTLSLFCSFCNLKCPK